MTHSFPDIVQRLRFGLADEGAMEDGATEIERLRTALSTAEKVIYDLTDGITGTTQRDEIERLRCSAATASTTAGTVDIAEAALTIAIPLPGGK